jgi:Zn-dependent protease
MPWDERPHYRDHSGASTNPLLWLVSGSVPLFTLFGVRVRAHATLFIFALGTVLFYWRGDYPIQVRAMTMAMWVAVVLLHEFAHCLVARRLGGQADDVLLWPLGGLTEPEPPHRAMATFLTAAAGPMLNIILCAGSALGVYYLTPAAAHAGRILVMFNPLHPPVPEFQYHLSWSNAAFYCWWLFFINYKLLLLNLLPILPLDGGQILQTCLWTMVGHFRSVLMATTIGMAGSVIVGLIALASQQASWFLAAAMVICFYDCYRRRIILRDSGTEDWRESYDFGSSLFAPTEKPRRRLSRHAIRKARRIALAEKAARDRIDAILAKVSARGITSLSFFERRALRKTTQQHRRCEMEMSKFQ